MTPHIAAKKLGISKATIYRWIKAGKLIATKKSNGYLMIDQDHVHQIISAAILAKLQTVGGITITQNHANEINIQF